MVECTLEAILGGCQNYGPFLGTLNIRCRTILGTQKGPIFEVLRSEIVNACPSQKTLARDSEPPPSQPASLTLNYQTQVLIINPNLEFIGTLQQVSFGRLR